eukprot:284816230_3
MTRSTGSAGVRPWRVPAERPWSARGWLPGSPDDSGTSGQRLHRSPPARGRARDAPRVAPGQSLGLLPDSSRAKSGPHLTVHLGLHLIRCVVLGGTYRCRRPPRPVCARTPTSPVLSFKDDSPSPLHRSSHSCRPRTTLFACRRTGRPSGAPGKRPAASPRWRAKLVGCAMWFTGWRPATTPRWRRSSLYCRHYSTSALNLRGCPRWRKSRRGSAQWKTTDLRPALANLAHLARARWPRPPQRWAAGRKLPGQRSQASCHQMV